MMGIPCIVVSPHAPTKSKYVHTKPIIWQAISARFFADKKTRMEECKSRTCWVGIVLLVNVLTGLISYLQRTGIGTNNVHTPLAHEQIFRRLIPAWPSACCVQFASSRILPSDNGMWYINKFRITYSRIFDIFHTTQVWAFVSCVRWLVWGQNLASRVTEHYESCAFAQAVTI